MSLISNLEWRKVQYKALKYNMSINISGAKSFWAINHINFWFGWLLWITEVIRHCVVSVNRKLYLNFLIAGSLFGHNAAVAKIICEPLKFVLVSVVWTFIYIPTIASKYNLWSCSAYQQYIVYWCNSSIVWHTFNSVQGNLLALDFTQMSALNATTYLTW